MLKGIGASSGIAIGKALLLNEHMDMVVKKEVEDTAKEEERLNHAVKRARDQIESIYKNILENMGAEKAEIFEAHLYIIDGPDLAGEARKRIHNDRVNAEYAVKAATDELAKAFEALNNEYMAERAADIRDIGKRIVGILMGAFSIPAGLNMKECILVAKDLTPSDTVQIDRERVKGFATEIGGRTSHSAIIARSLEIPAVVGLGESIRDIKDGDMLILDGDDGIIIINPSDEVLSEYSANREKYIEYKKSLYALKEAESITYDGKRVEIFANISSLEDVQQVLDNGAEGIGLFRTEFLYMAKHSFPTEEEQFEAYKAVLVKMSGKPVIIRTLDVGGDKEISYLPLGKEMNPFLGYRAIRLCLDRVDILKTQLRALLKASLFGNLKIMFPMISTLQEMRKAKAVIEECKNELKIENIQFDENVEIGIMIEVPSAALISDVLAKESDFFSIGTNDLIQYTIAVDRMNEKVSYLYDFYNPAVLRLIKIVIENAHKEGKSVGMCGEMAGKNELIPVLIGMGLDEFSMSASAVLDARKTIRETSYDKAKLMADEVVSCGTSDEVYEVIKSSGSVC